MQIYKKDFGVAFSPWLLRLCHTMPGCPVLDADLKHDMRSGDRDNDVQLYCILNPNISPEISENNNIDSILKITK